MDAVAPFESEVVDGFFLPLLSVGVPCKDFPPTDLESMSVFSCGGAGAVTDFASSLSFDLVPETRAFGLKDVDFLGSPVLLSVDFDLDLEGLPPTDLESKSVFVVEEDFSFICLGTAVTDFESLSGDADGLDLGPL